MMQERIEWIDIAKGLGMLIVIAGHTISLTYSYPLYAFHMPLFFFLSGLVYKDREETFKEFIISKAKALLKPWAIILLISFIVCLLIPQWRNALTINAILADFYTANTNTLQNSSLWYLVCFFFVLIMFFFINKIKRSYFIVTGFILFAVALLWIKNALNETMLPFHRLPFKIDSALVALVFFSIACWNRGFVYKLVSYRFHVLFLLMLIMLTAGLSYYNGWSNINSLDFGTYKLFYYPIAFMGICSTVMVSHRISHSDHSKIRAFLVFYGKNSLIIFAFQSLLIRLYLYSFNNIQGLNMRLYSDNPMTHQVGSFVIVSFIMSPVIVYLFELIKNCKKYE